MASLSSHHTGIYLMVDIFISWTFWGVLIVQLVRYAATLKSHPGRESPFQIASIGVLFVARTVHTLISLSRVIAVHSLHWGDAAWANLLRHNFQSAVSFFLGLAIIASVQLLYVQRALEFARSLIGGPLDRVRKFAVAIFVVLFSICLIMGLASEISKMRLPSYSAMSVELAKPGLPAFLVLEIVWLGSALLLSILHAVMTSRDVMLAHRYTQANSLRETKMTSDILKEMVKAGLSSAVLICSAITVYIFVSIYYKHAVAGRGCAALPAIYVFNLLFSVLQPRALRERQILEAAVAAGGEQPRQRPHGAFQAKKRLLALVGGKRRRSSSKTAVHSASTDGPRQSHTRAAKLGFFNLLVRDDDGGGSSGADPLPQPFSTTCRRRSSAGLPVAGVSRTIEVRSYFERVDDFDETEGPFGSVHEGEDWAARNLRLGIGNSVWVENRRSRRPLSTNDHSSSTLSVPAENTDRDQVSSFSTVRSAFTGVSQPRRGPSPRRPPLTPAGATSFLSSFPTGPVRSQVYSRYDPDLDMVDLPPVLGMQPVEDDEDDEQTFRVVPPSPPPAHV